MVCIIATNVAPPELLGDRTGDPFPRGGPFGFYNGIARMQGRQIPCMLPRSQQRPMFYSTNQKSSVAIFIGKPIPRSDRFLRRDSGPTCFHSNQARGKPSKKSRTCLRRSWRRTTTLPSASMWTSPLDRGRSTTTVIWMPGSKGRPLLNASACLHPHRENRAKPDFCVEKLLR